MKYVCTIIIYKENKYMHVSYNVKKRDSKFQKSGPKQKLSTNVVANKCIFHQTIFP